MCVCVRLSMPQLRFCLDRSVFSLVTTNTRPVRSMFSAKPRQILKDYLTVILALSACAVLCAVPARNRLPPPSHLATRIPSVHCPLSVCSEVQFQFSVSSSSICGI